MSLVISYHCSKKCGLSVYLYNFFPIWKKDTPARSRKIPIEVWNSEYVLYYFSHKVCLICKKIVKVKIGSNECPDCKNLKFLKDGDPCHLCPFGTVINDRADTICF